ncbi:hypothetical protein C4Q27_25265 [Pseudomonas sp. SWI36]|nr:hypothetical protein C4Q27_25265 [Pseudomonas sp. SWI36]
MVESEKKLRNIARILERYDISPSRVLSIKIMKSGMENEVIRVTLSDGHVIVRRHLKNSLSGVEFECAILDRIVGKFEKITTPHLRRTIDGKAYCMYQGEIFTVYNYLSGSPVSESSPRLIAEVCDFATRFQQVTSLFQWPTTNQWPSISQTQDLALQFTRENREAFTDQEMNFLHARIDDLSMLRSVLDRFPIVVVHGDLHGGNLLTDFSGDLNAVLDFDDAFMGSSILEFAGIVRGHCFDDCCRLLPEQCNNVYLQAGASTKKNCSLIEFYKIIDFTCLKYLLHAYFMGRCKNPSPRIFNQLLYSQQVDFQKWVGHRHEELKFRF